MADKPIKTIVKLQVPAGKANPAPPVGTALGPHGVDMNAFCQAFNSQTSQMGDAIIPCVITIYEDRTLSFITKQPPASFLIKKALNLKKGSAVPQKDKVASITRAQLEAIANDKMVDLNANDLDAAVKIIAGTCRSMGVKVDS